MRVREQRVALAASLERAHDVVAMLQHADFLRREALLRHPVVNELQHLAFVPDRARDVAQREREIDYLGLADFTEHLFGIAAQFPADLDINHCPAPLSCRRSCGSGW